MSKKNAGNFTVLHAAQQQSSTCRNQKSLSMYLKFSVEENELTPSFQNRQEDALNFKNQTMFEKRK